MQHFIRANMLLKVDCLPNAVGKQPSIQPSIPLINLERE